MAHKASSILDRLDSGLQQQKKMAASARKQIKQETSDVKVKMELMEKSHAFEDYEEDHSNIIENYGKVNSVMRRDSVLHAAPTAPKAMRLSFHPPSAPRIMRDAEEFLERTQGSQVINSQPLAPIQDPGLGGPTLEERKAQSTKAKAANKEAKAARERAADEEKKKRKAESAKAKAANREVNTQFANEERERINAEAKESLKAARRAQHLAEIAAKAAKDAVLEAVEKRNAANDKQAEEAEKPTYADEIADLTNEEQARRARKAERQSRSEAHKVSTVANRALRRRIAIETEVMELLDEVSRRALASEKIMVLKTEIEAREAAGQKGSRKKLKRARQALEAALREDVSAVPDQSGSVSKAQAAGIEKLNEENAGTRRLTADEQEIIVDPDYHDDFQTMFGDEKSAVKEQQSRINSRDNITKRKSDETDLANELHNSRREAKRRRKEEKALKAITGTPKKSKKSKSEAVSCQELTKGQNDEEMLDEDDQQLHHHSPHHHSPPKQLQNLRQLVRKDILPPKKQQSSNGHVSAASPRPMSFEGPQDNGAQISEQLVPHASVHPEAEATGDPYQWMPAAWKDSFIGTVNHVRSTLRTDSAPNEQFNWLPSAQRESLLDTIRNSKAYGSFSANTEKVFSATEAPKAMVTFNLTTQPKLFSSGVFKTPTSKSSAAGLGDKNGLSSTPRTVNSVIVPVSVFHNSAQAAMQKIVSRDSGDTAATILPPARDYIIPGTVQASAPSTILPPLFSQQNDSSANAAASKATPILRRTLQLSSTPRATGSAILPPNFKRSFSTPQAPSVSTIIPQVSASKVILPPTRNDQPATNPPSSGSAKLRSSDPSHSSISKGLNKNSNTPSTTTKLNALSTSEDKKGINETSTPATKPKKHNSKRDHIDELPEEAEIREVGNKRQKRTITTTSSPSPIPVPIIATHPRRKSDLPAVKRGLDLMLTQQEEWEVTGGRFRGRVNLSSDKNDDAEVEENIAFSSLYIQNRPKPITIANLKFRILRLASGESSDLSGDIITGVQVCSVARGRVKVNIAGKKFSIGEGGMWRVRGGESCKVRNQLSEGAIVHVSDVN